MEATRGNRVDNEMQATKKNRVDVDVTAEIPTEMLRFISTDKVANLEKLAHSSLYAANKYELKRWCRR
ncbi:PREDICTED: speckle-type POZ protein-like [Vollenhovia emeryi]|uniref:speckle-type POZ protein-like n=1 Tax=Vollenhovia emeryi TaxID=411798 RepID=UPI0005F4ACDF|nr:PREDICTED: speckle-type POZ protein-like [Vollenhovia emeryi]